MKASQFRIAAEIKPDKHDWGLGRWISHPLSTDPKQLAVLDAIIMPGQRHDFHKHPDQEEVLFVVSGNIEQWIDRAKRILGPGDAVFIAPGTVHGSFNTGAGEARVIVIFSPCLGEVGIEMVDVANEAPWKGLRN